MNGSLERMALASARCYFARYCESHANQYDETHISVDRYTGQYRYLLHTGAIGSSYLLMPLSA